MSIAEPRALIALQDALDAAFRADATLAGLVGGRIHDGPAKGLPTPWLAFTDASALDWSVAESDGVRAVLTLEAVGSDAERTRVLAVLDAAAAVVGGPLPALAAGTLVLIRTTGASVHRTDGGRTWRARLTVEALIDG